MTDLHDPKTSVTGEQVEGLMEYMEKNMSSIYAVDLSRLFAFILLHYRIDMMAGIEILMDAMKLHTDYKKEENEEEELCDDCAEEEDPIH